MNLTDNRYTPFGLVRDMMQTPEIVAAFDPSAPIEAAGWVANCGRLLLTGEGSSRIFPAKHMMLQARRRGSPLAIHTEAGWQS
ncbi:MAG: sugar isomerase, partial [Tepidisphaeraceae bacterium]